MKQKHFLKIKIAAVTFETTSSALLIGVNGASQ